jgi:hypothetical protein
MDDHLLHLPGDVEVELLFTGEEFLGLGRITVAGLHVRDGSWPICPRIETPDSWYFHRFTLLATEQEGEAVVLRTRAEALLLPRQYRTDWYRPMVPTNLHAPPTAEVDWVLAPQQVTVGDEAFRGLSYRFRYRSEAPIHRLTDWGTFELGGQAEGNLLVSRTCFRAPENPLTREGRYTSQEEYGGSRDHPTWCFRQMMPRFGAHQCFDFQWNPTATLLLAYDRPAYINSVVHKEAGENQVQVVDEHWFALTGEAQPPAHWVLVHRPAQAEKIHQGRTRWMRCWQWSRRHYGEQIGLLPMKPYLMCQVAGYAEPNQPATGVQVLERVRDEILPWAARLGFNAIYFEPWWECNASQEELAWGCASGAATSVSVCAPYDHRFAEGWGGDALMKQVADAGRAVGVKALPWLGTPLANRMPDSPVFREHPSWRVLDLYGGPYDGKYGDIAAPDLLGPYGDHLFAQLRHFTEDLGIEGWFFDSYSNLTIMPVNFADPLLRPQIERVWEMQRYCQEHGVAWAIEADGPFGIGKLGMGSGVVANLNAEVSAFGGPGMTLDDYSGERAYTLLDANHSFPYDSAHDGDFPADTYFRSLACGGPLCVSMWATQTTLWDWATPEVVSWNRAYQATEAQRVRPTLLPDDLGIIWDDPAHPEAGRALWTFRAGEIPLAQPSQALNLLTQESLTVGETLVSAGLGVFLLTPA